MRCDMPEDAPATPGPSVEAARNNETKNTRRAPVPASKLLCLAVSITAIATAGGMPSVDL